MQTARKMLNAIANPHPVTADPQARRADEMEGKRSLTSSYTVSLANPDELASKILMNEVYGLNEEELRQFSQKIQSVNLAQVNQVAKQLLHPDKLVVVTAGPDVSAQGKSRKQKANFSLCHFMLAVL